MMVTQEKLVPLGDAVLIRRLAPEASIGSLVLPDNAQRTNPRGKVLAVGTGRMLDSGVRNELQVKVGDTVMVAPGTPVGGVKLEGHGDDIFVVDYDCIWGIIR